MNTIELFFLRLSILVRKRLGYRLPQLNEARPIRTGRFDVYRHHGRLVRLEPMDAKQRSHVDDLQARLDAEYLDFKRKAMQEWKDTLPSEPTDADIEKWDLMYEAENERPEYRPCETCIFSAETPGSVLPCPHYNVVANSMRHACCTHNYVIIKDVDRI